MTQDEKLRLFVERFEKGEMPDRETLNDLASGFRDYLDGQGSLDECLGLTDNRLKRTAPERERRKAERSKKTFHEYMKLFEEMWEVMQVFEVSVKKAAEMVALRREDFENKSRPTDATLEQYWKAHEANLIKGTIPIVFKGHLDPTELKEELRARYPERALYGVK